MSAVHAREGWRLPCAEKQSLTYKSRRWISLPLPRRQAMIDEFDLDQDGEINEQEFVQIMMDEG